MQAGRKVGMGVFAIVKMRASPRRMPGGRRRWRPATPVADGNLTRRLFGRWCGGLRLCEATSAGADVTPSKDARVVWDKKGKSGLNGSDWV
jgi:hypothetical protein